VSAALELVRTLAGEAGVQAHAGVHAGPVVQRDRDVFGRTVNLAARIAQRAEAGEVLVSEAVVDAAGGDARRFEFAQDAVLKGVTERVRLFRVTEVRSR
jgi:class 3 adenylate cyclase